MPGAIEEHAEIHSKKLSKTLSRTIEPRARLLHPRIDLIPTNADVVGLYVADAGKFLTVLSLRAG